MQTASKDKSSAVFHQWASSLVKPIKSDLGKFVFKDSTPQEIASTINRNYINPENDSFWKQPVRVSRADIDALKKAVSDFDFTEAAQEAAKVTKDFKATIDFQAVFCKQITPYPT